MNIPYRPTRFVWTAAGCPSPAETDGTIIVPKGRRGACAGCASEGEFNLSQAITDSFTTTRNASRAWPFGGTTLCAACVWACKTLALRCALWFARIEDSAGDGGVWFAPSRPRGLDVLLAPPEPPFVAALPMYGVRHGGESHIHRTVWSYGNGGLTRPLDPLIRLQSKHVAIYAQISYSRIVYPLQVDDLAEVIVDVPLWSALRARAEELGREIVSAGIFESAAREALRTLKAPARLRMGPSAWREKTAPFVAHHGAAWWGLFVRLLDIDLNQGNP